MSRIGFNLEDGIATVVIDRPQTMNAVTPEMRAELHQIWERVRTDPEIRVVIITGAGDKAFCVGGDLKRPLAPQTSAAEQVFGAPFSRSLHTGMERCDAPVIAAINGHAIAGGLQLALACDIRICSENARFAFSEVRIGTLPGGGATQRLPRLVGQSNAMLMALTAERIDAQEALRIGLVSRVVPHGQLMDAARAIAKRIAGNAPLAVRATKRLINHSAEAPLSAGLDAERYAFSLLHNTEDRAEGRQAFVEKRRPQFKGK
jgi:E-phenylitaconyl-CoA hydratase